MDGDKKLRSPLAALYPYGPFKDVQAGDSIGRELGELHVKVLEHLFEERHSRKDEAHAEEGLENHSLMAPRCWERLNS